MVTLLVASTDPSKLPQISPVDLNQSISKYLANLAVVNGSNNMSNNEAAIAAIAAAQQAQSGIVFYILYSIV
jgi:hypothetical protein